MSAIVDIIVSCKGRISIHTELDSGLSTLAMIDSRVSRLSSPPEATEVLIQEIVETRVTDGEGRMNG